MGEISNLFNQDALKWIKKEVEESCDRDDEGNIVLNDEKGEPLYLGARLMTIKEFGDRLVNQYPSAAKATGASGTKDSAAGSKSKGVRIPGSLAELMSLPNGNVIWDKMSHEERRSLAKGTKIS